VDRPYSTYPNSKYVGVGIYDLAVLLHNTWQAACDPDVGHEDCRMTAQDFLLRMQKRVPTHKDDVEHMLWAAQLLSEKGRFWHPRNAAMGDFVRAAFARWDFDPKLCLLTKKEGLPWLSRG
jgi:hypothetical protein